MGLNRWCDTTDISPSAPSAPSSVTHMRGTPAEAVASALPSSDLEQRASPTRVQAAMLQKGTATPQQTPSGWQTGRLGETPRILASASYTSTIGDVRMGSASPAEWVLQQQQIAIASVPSAAPSRANAMQASPEMLTPSRGEIPPPPLSPVESSEGANQSTFVFTAPL